MFLATFLTPLFMIGFGAAVGAVGAEDGKDDWVPWLVGGLMLGVGAGVA